MIFPLNDCYGESLSLNELWYASKLCMRKVWGKSLPKLLEEGKKEGNTSSFLLFKKKKEGKFWKFSWFYDFGMDRESSLVLKWSWLRLIVLWMLWFTLFSWGFVNVKAYVWKRWVIWWLCLRMVHCSNSCFYLKFMMFICLFERPLSPQAFYGS